MKSSNKQKIIVLLNLCLLFAFSGGTENEEKRAVVRLKQGAVEGSIFSLGGVLKVEQYLGIPYAQAPIGDLRWKSPKKYDGWQHEKPYATTYGPNCPQLAILSDPTADASKVIGNEDCLYLNIYRQHRSTDAPLQPVMVFIHGGAWIYSSADIYRAYALATFGSVIAVTFNYRLGALGFMSSENITKDGMFNGNYGLLDQYAALSWVQEYIEYFGGDKNQVTIFGESVGAVSVLLQAMSPFALHTTSSDSKQPSLFKRVIAQSGVTLVPGAISKPGSAKNFILNSPCSDLTENEMLECLKNLTAVEIVRLQRNFQWRPVVDKKFIGDFPDSFMKNEQQNFRGIYDFILGLNDVDVISVLFEEISQVKSLSMLQSYTNRILARSYDNTEKVTDIVIEKYLNISSEENNSNKWRRIALNITRDFTLLAPTIKFADIASSYMRSNVYLYYFVQTPSNGLINAQLAIPRNKSQEWVEGARHTEELPYVFGAPFSFSDTSQDDKTLSMQMIIYWTNFAKTGNPNSNGVRVTWPTYNSSSGKYMRFGRKSSHEDLVEVRSHLTGDLYKFWTEEISILSYKRKQVHIIAG
ncbi:carboxylesterase 4A-like isoform X2 [Styela clava]